jgi:hypothetical protein
VSSHDPIGVALASIGAGAATGASVVTASLLIFRIIQAGTAAPSPDQQFLLISGGLMGGLIAAVVTVLVLTQTLSDLWRRAVAAGLAVFGTALLTVGAGPADILGGVGGLASYVALLLGGAIYARRRARMAASP